MTMRDASEVIAAIERDIATFDVAIPIDTVRGYIAQLSTLPASTPPGDAQPAAADVVALKAIAAGMREWATGEGCFNDDPDGEPLLCVYWAQQGFLALCDQIDAAIKGDSHAG